MTPPCGSETDKEGPGDKAGQEMDRWTHAQTDQRMDRQTHACVDQGMPDGALHGWTHSRICVQTALTNYHNQRSQQDYFRNTLLIFPTVFPCKTI